MATKTERLYFRCTEELKKKLKEMAKKEHRSVSNYLEKIIAEKMQEEL